MPPVGQSGVGAGCECGVGSLGVGVWVCGCGGGGLWVQDNGCGRVCTLALEEGALLGGGAMYLSARVFFFGV